MESWAYHQTSPPTEQNEQKQKAHARCVKMAATSYHHKAIGTQVDRARYSVRTAGSQGLYIGVYVGHAKAVGSIRFVGKAATAVEVHSCSNVPKAPQDRGRLHQDDGYGFDRTLCHGLQCPDSLEAQHSNETTAVVDRCLGFFRSQRLIFLRSQFRNHLLLEAIEDL